MRLWEALKLPRAPRLALIGGGGKTTALFQLGREAREMGLAPILTTTTRMFFPEEHLDWLWPCPWPDPSAPQERVPYLYRTRQGQPDKVLGLPAQDLDRLASLYPHCSLIYEADGSRGRPVKLHGTHEPVVADCTDHTVVVLGMSAWGRPLTEETVHRAELLAELHGQPLDLDTAEFLVARMLKRARGEASLLLTQAEGDRERQAAQQLARRLQGFSQVVASHHSWCSLLP